MANIAFIGMGSMGSRMALNLIKAGHNVYVWNRNIKRTISIVEAGARAANSPREASENADFVISMLRDNDASKSAWCDNNNGALVGMKPGAIAIDCSTLTVDWVRQLNQYCADKNIKFLDAPVAGSRPQAEAAQLIFFVGGNKNTFDQAHPILLSMGNAIHYAGTSGTGASIKLAVNALFGIQVATMAELIGLFKTAGLDANHAVDILTSTPVCSTAAKVASSAMLAGNFSPMFPIELVEKDFSYAAAAASENGLVTPMTQAAWRVFQHAVERGFGDDNITGVAQVYIQPRCITESLTACDKSITCHET